MNTYIAVIRYPYEEPHHLNLVIAASNGRAVGRLEFYLSADALLEWAEGMERFPMHANSVQRWEIGSERPA